MTPEQRRIIEEELKRAGLQPGMTIRAAGLRVKPGTFDSDARSVRFVATTEKAATVWDWDRWEFVEEILRADGMVEPDSGQVPLLDAHSRNSVADVLGSAADFSDCEAGGEAGKDCEVVFSSVQAGQDAARKVEEGHITDVSVGYLVTESYYVPEGEKQIIQGKEYEGPVRVSTRWELRELSLVPIGADSLAKARAAVITAGKDNHTNGGQNMPKEAGKENKKKKEEKTQPAERADQNNPPAPAVDPEAIRKARQEAVRAERERGSAINDAVAVAGLGNELAREMVENGSTLDQARAKILEKLKEKNQAIGAGTGSGFEMGEDCRDKFRAATTDALLMSTGVRIEKPAAGAREFRGYSLLDFARESLELVGVRTRGLSRRQLAGRAISPASTSDFPLLMSAVVGRHLMAAYDEASATWRPFVSVTGASDFKDIYGIKLSESPDLLDLDENGEYRTAAFSENQEKYRVVTKGRKVKLTRQMIINNDLRAFTRIPTLFGAAARRMEADAVYSLITSNPVMSDGKALFHADHHNLIGSGAPVSPTSLSTTRLAMRQQKGMKGARLDITPAFVLIPLEQETDSEIVLRSTALPDDNKSSGVHNPWANKLTPIADGRLSDDSATAWYMVASPNQAPVIEVAYLEGEEQPFIDDEVEFSSDSLVVKVRHDFGAGIMDHVGIVKNPGE